MGSPYAQASHTLDRGAPVSLAREGLGHANLVTTSHYAHDTHARPGSGLDHGPLPAVILLL